MTDVRTAKGNPELRLAGRATKHATGAALRWAASMMSRASVAVSEQLCGPGRVARRVALGSKTAPEISIHTARTPSEECQKPDV